MDEGLLLLFEEDILVGLVLIADGEDDDDVKWGAVGAGKLLLLLLLK